MEMPSAGGLIRHECRSQCESMVNAGWKQDISGDVSKRGLEEKLRRRRRRRGNHTECVSVMLVVGG